MKTFFTGVLLQTLLIFIFILAVVYFIGGPIGEELADKLAKLSEALK